MRDWRSSRFSASESTLDQGGGTVVASEEVAESAETAETVAETLEAPEIVEETAETVAETLEAPETAEETAERVAEIAETAETAEIVAEPAETETAESVAGEAPEAPEPAETPETTSTPQEAVKSRLPASVVTLLAAMGVFCANAAFVAGRLGHADSVWSNRVYWLGQAFILVPIGVRLFSRRPLSKRDTITLLVVLTVAEYLLKVCYSPAALTFSDELLQWRSSVNILNTGDPFTVNYGIPVGPHYPGLQLVTAALMSATGLSLFPAALIVAGIAHLLFICVLYCVFYTLTRSHRVGAIAVLIYYTTPDLTSFNSMYVYETLALAFLGITLLAALKLSTLESREERVRWFIIAVLGILATVITHHVTSYILTASLILVAVVGRFTGSRAIAARIGALAAISVAAVACWIIFVAPYTITYFTPTVQGVVQGLNSLLGSGTASAPSTSLSPLNDQLLEGLGIMAMTVLLVFGCWQVWRSYKSNSWVIAMMIGSLGWFGALGVRVGFPDGQELAGRTATFVYIPVSLITALALTKFVNSPLVRSWRVTAMGVGAVAVIVLQFDGLANGWPPFWERLPGPYQVAGVERSTGPEEIAMADWTLAKLGPGNRFASDVGNYPALAGYGYQDPLQNVAYLFTSPTLTPSIVLQFEEQEVQYVLADNRLTEALPVSGSYFPGQSAANQKLPLIDLAKFNSTGIPRVFDDGNIVIYDLQSPAT
jgi:hypothetical protein